MYVCLKDMKCLDIEYFLRAIEWIPMELKAMDMNIYFGTISYY